MPPPAPPQTLEEESLLYEETPVQIISLLDLEPVDTRASANPVRVGGGTLDPVDQAEMASVLAECTLKDNTIVRLYVTAEGLIDGAFLRPGAGWIRFARLYRGADQGPNYAETAALTACSGILGHDGFLLRTDGHCSGVYSYDYYWFDTAGDLQVLTARMDPVALDLDGDGTAELAWEIAAWQGAFSFYFRRTDGAICCVTPSEYIDASGLFLAAVEAPVRTLNVLSQRIAPYYQWAKSYRLQGIQIEGQESWRAGWLYRLCEDITEKIKQNWTMQTRFNEEEKAQMFIGYLAAFPKSEKNETKTEEDTVNEQ